MIQKYSNDVFFMLLPGVSDCSTGSPPEEHHPVLPSPAREEAEGHSQPRGRGHREGPLTSLEVNIAGNE